MKSSSISLAWNFWEDGGLIASLVPSILVKTKGTAMPQTTSAAITKPRTLLPSAPLNLVTRGRNMATAAEQARADMVIR